MYALKWDMHIFGGITNLQKQPVLQHVHCTVSAYLEGLRKDAANAEHIRPYLESYHIWSVLFTKPHVIHDMFPGLKGNCFFHL